MFALSFRFLAANLFAGRVDTEHFARVLDDVRPDILVTVELAPRAAEVIASRFPHHHLEAVSGYEGWGLAAHVPLEVQPGRPGWGRGGAGRLDLGSVTLHLAAVHLLDPLHFPLRGTAEIRSRQVGALLQWGDGLPHHEPQLVAGDLNAGRWWPEYRRLVGRWDDLIETGAPATKPRRTWGLPWGPKLLRIDHVLGSGLTATANQAVRVRGSDHSAVVVDLTLLNG